MSTLQGRAGCTRTGPVQSVTHEHVVIRRILFKPGFCHRSIGRKIHPGGGDRHVTSVPIGVSRSDELPGEGLCERPTYLDKLRLRPVWQSLGQSRPVSPSLFHHRTSAPRSATLSLSHCAPTRSTLKPEHHHTTRQPHTPQRRAPEIMADDSSDLSSLSSLSPVPSDLDSEPEPEPKAKKGTILKFFNKLPKDQKAAKAAKETSPPPRKRSPSPAHEYVFADNPDIAVR